MGIFTVEVEIGDPAGGRHEAVDVLVDTGATYTLVRASVLRGLGVEPNASSQFELADSSLRSFDIGEARVRVGGLEIATLVVFGDEDMPPLLAPTPWRG